MRTISTREVERSLAAVFFERELAGRLRDEAPAAYEDISAVMRAQRDLVRIVRRLRPVLALQGCEVRCLHCLLRLDESVRPAQHWRT
jgi:tRNA-splicing ligase RtcB